MKIETIIQNAHQPIIVSGVSDTLYRIGTILKGNGRYFIVSHFMILETYGYHTEALMDHSKGINSKELLDLIWVELEEVTDGVELNSVKNLMDNTLNLLKK